MGVREAESMAIGCCLDDLVDDLVDECEVDCDINAPPEI
jgi:hypothetical protein